MAQEYKYICLRDILKKEKFPKLSFFKYLPSESEVESDYPSAKAMAMSTPSPFAIANSSAQVGESSGLNSSRGGEEKTKRISGTHLLSKNCNSSGTIYKRKLLAAAPISSLKSSKSGEPLIYQTSEGNGGAFVPDTTPTNKIPKLATTICIHYKSISNFGDHKIRKKKEAALIGADLTHSAVAMPPPCGGWWI